MNVATWLLLATVILVIVAYKKGLFDKKHEAAQPTAVVKSPVGKWVGQVQPATNGTWGGENDEHDPAYTAKVLAEIPHWRGLGYCPGGSFAFEVHPDGSITGGASIYGHPEPVHGLQVLPSAATEIEFPLASHMVKLKFDGDTVTGLLWEGHDTLKRANVVGGRV